MPSRRTSPWLIAAHFALAQDGLRGNRAIAAHPMHVVRATTQAYPLLLGTHLETAQAAAAGAPEEQCFKLWAQQVTRSAFIAV